MNTVLSKLILCCTLFLSGLNLQAANYYFSSEIGDDSRSSSQAQSANSPWKSINKLNAIIPSLKPGDKVFFRRGDVFYGSILINNTGMAGAPITFGAYGSGPEPVITSLVRLSNWQSVGNGVYEAGDSRLPNHKVNMVTINDIPQEMGRYPNSNTAEKGYLTYESHSGNRSISDYQLSSSPNWTGGELVIRKVYWITDRHRITSHSGNTVNYAPNPDTSYEPRAGYGYYIQDHPSTLDRYGEWYYNPLNKKLRVYFGGDPGNTHLEVSTFDFIVHKTGQARYITFENLHFKGANRNAFQFVGGNDIKIINCKMDFSGENGLFIEGVSNLQVENSQVNHSNNLGMNIRNSQSAVIRGNKIYSTYLFPGHGRSGDNVGLAMFTDGDNNLIEYNEIKKTGYIGIRFGGNDTQVRYNYIDGFCYTKNDGGGIYTYQHKNTRFKNRKITNNIILNGLGVKEGTTIENFVSKAQAEGIYLDDNVTDVEVSGNTVGHMATKGIYLHNTDNIRVINNTVYDAENLIFLRNDLMGNALTNTLIENNKLLAKDASQNFVYVHSIYNDVAELARFNNNQYSAPFSDNFRFRVRYNANSSNEARKFYDLSGWQRAFNNDWNSKTSEPMDNLYQVTEKVGSNRYANGTFDRDVNLISCSDCTNSWDSGKLDGGSLKISTRGKSQSTLRTGQLKKGKYYMLKFTGVADKNIPVSFYLRQSSSPWFHLSHKHKVGINWQKNEKEILIQALADMDESRLVMEIETGESGVLWMDNLEFYEVKANVIKPEDKVLFEKNPSKQKQSFSTVGGFVGLLYQYLSETLSIEPYSSILMLKSGSGTIEKVLASPTVKLTKPESNHSSRQGETIMIEADASISDGEIAQVDFYNGSNKLGSISSPPYTYAWKNPPSGSFEITAVAIADNGQQASSSPVALQINATTSSAQPATNFFINAGSNEDAELSGLRFSGENQNNQFYTTSKEYEAINASSYKLFQTERFGPTLGYNIPVPNGTYYVYTFHNELWFGKEGPSSKAGQRVFNIAIENNTLKRDFDLYKENQNNPMVLTFKEVEVSDGNLNLYLSASTDNASISGIVISEEPINIPSDLTDGVPPTENNELVTYSDYLMINTGSREDVSYDGKTFVSDYKTSYFTSPSANFNLTVADDPLFQTERYAKNMSIRIPLENGTYQVKTYHNELWFGSFGPTAAVGNRVFDISIEGELKKDNFDIYAEKGNAPTVLTFDNIEVTDGALNLDLNASKDNATISGLYIARASGGSTKPGVSQPNQAAIFLNAGSYEAAEHNNQTYVGDRNTSYPGTSKINFNYSVGGSEMFLTERYSNNLYYSIPVENGTYTVVTYHNELWFGSFGPAARSGNRVFNIDIEDKRVKSNFDIYKENNNKPTTLTFRSIVVTDGILDISLGAVTDNATLSGLAVIPEGGTYASNLRLAATEDENQILDIQSSEATTLAETKVYPNPASHKTSLTLGRDVAISEIYLQSTSGALVKSIDPKTSSDGFGTYTIPLEGLQSGVYVLTVSNGRDWIKKIKLIVE